MADLILTGVVLAIAAFALFGGEFAIDLHDETESNKEENGGEKDEP